MPHPNNAVWTLDEIEAHARKFPEHKETRRRVIREKRVPWPTPKGKKDAMMRFNRILEEAGIKPKEEVVKKKTTKKKVKKTEK